MEDIKKILGNDILEEISRQADGDISSNQVADVLNAVLPQIMENAESGELAKRSAEVERGGMLDLLPLLLGGNSAGITNSVAQSTGVSSGGVNSILKIAAPILLYMLLSNNNSSQQSSGAGLLGALLGGQQQSSGAGLLGALLGGGQPQQVQQNNTASLLGALLGGGQQPQQVQQQNNTASLLGALLGGGQQPQQVQQQSGGGLLDLLGGTQQTQQPQQVQQTQQQSSGGGLLNALFSLMADDGN